MATKARTRDDYTVGWVCALPTELVAATVMLDDIHDDLPKPANDQNTYTLGSIGKHNVVITCLPKGRYGVSPATTVAVQMIDTFPTIKVGLMVGIGGSASSEVKLGDVVVSTPTEQFSGVVQWDFGKAEDGGNFKRTGTMNSPPNLLLTAISKLEAKCKILGHKIPHYLKGLEKKYPNLSKKYVSSDSLEDVLFKPDYSHVKPADGDEENEDCRFCDKSKTVTRKPEGFRVHYGLIASGNQVIKDAACRDRLNKSLGGNLLCVEMEAAGLMNNFPCIVIRGICDYADSHKNKDWQEYAATVAAAFAKELLECVQPNDINQERHIRDILNQVHDNTTTTRDNVIHMKSKLDKDDNDKVLNWLTHTDYILQQSDHFARRQPGTGEWLLNSKEFRYWLDNNSQTLFCPGIPGAGKTILTSIVVEELKMRFSDDPTTEIAYIYCSFQRKEQQTPNNLLASLLRQLSQSLSPLPKSVQDLHDQHKIKQTRPLLNETSKALQSVAGSYSKVFIIIDALDEVSDMCLKRILPELFSLQKNSAVNIFATSRYIPEIVGKFRSSKSFEIRASKIDVMRYLESHIGELRPFVQENEKLQAEIKVGISEAVDGMFLLAHIYLSSLEDKLTINDIRSALNDFLAQGKAKAKDNGQILADAYGNTMDRISGKKEGLRDLAMKVLSWLTYAKRPLNKLELQCALAIRPDKPRLDEGDLLKPEDMVSVCAGLVTIDEGSNIIRLTHYTTQEYLERTMNKWFPDANVNITEACITYLSFDHSGAGLHAGEEDFQGERLTNLFYDYAAQNWGHHARVAANAVKDRVIGFLSNGYKFSGVSQLAMTYGGYPDYGQSVTQQMTSLHVAAYFGLAKVAAALLINGDHPDQKDSNEQTPLFLAAASGHNEVVSILLASNNVDINSRNKYGRTPLFCAVEKGNMDAIKQLLQQDGIDRNSPDIYGQTPLAWAEMNGNVDAVDLLVAKEYGSSTEKNISQGPALLLNAAKLGDIAAAQAFLDYVQADTPDENRQTPLMWAARKGHKAIVELLLKSDARFDLKDALGRTPLWHAAHNGHRSVVEILLKPGAVEADHCDNNGFSPLLCAADRGYMDVLKLLIKGMKLGLDDSERKAPLQYARGIIHLLSKDDGAKLGLGTKEGQELLQQAAERGHLGVIRFLLHKGVDGNTACGSSSVPLSYAEGVIRLCHGSSNISANLVDKQGRAILLHATEKCHIEVLQLLLDKGANVELGDSKNGQTPLLHAARNGRKAVVQLLLDKSANIEVRNIHNGQTPLSYAAENGHETVVRLLLHKGARVDSKDNSDRTPLLGAAMNGYEAVVRLLLDKGANIELKNKQDGRSPLSYAAEHGHKEIVKLLINRGADIESTDINGRTPLLYATWEQHEIVAQQLLDRGARFETQDKDGQTPLLGAAKNGHQAIVQQLLDMGADIESTDNKYGRTPLWYAAGNGHTALVHLLINRGAKVESRDKDGRTPLWCATGDGHEAVVRLLLQKGAKAQSKDDQSRTLLWWAAGNGHEAIVRLLLDKGAEVKSRDSLRRTPLFAAIDNGHEAVVQLLLNNGADVETEDYFNRTPLWHAVENGYEAIAELLLNKGAKVEVIDGYGRTPLWRAARNGQHTLVEKLLGRGALVNSKDKDGWTPLLAAAGEGHEGIVRLLLSNGAKIESKDKDGQTPLSRAAVNGNKATVNLLLSKGANVASKDRNGWTPLWHAAGNGHEAAVLLLLGKGSKLDSKDKYGWTPLSYASRCGHKVIVQLLLGKGAKVQSEDKNGQTPLLNATRYGHEAIAQLLLNKGAKLDSKDKDGQTPLLCAAKSGDSGTIRLLLEKGAKVESKDRNGQTPLLVAASNGYGAIVQQLLDEGARVESKDKNGQTPLLNAAIYGHEAVVRLLMDKGAKLESTNNKGQTPLLAAAINGHEVVVGLLLEKNAKLEIRDRDGLSPLLGAIKYGHQAVQQLLLQYGAERHQ